MKGFNVWLVAVIVIFVFVQIYQWLQAVLLPLPVYVIAGAFLAIASNLHHGRGSFDIPSSRESLPPNSPEQ